MKYSVGVDIVDVKDFEKRSKRTKHLVKRLFTNYEINYCSKRGIEHLASRFATKEAFAKASNLKKLAWHGVEIRNMPSGKPYLNIRKYMKNKLKIKSIDVSISNTKNIAVAVVIINY